jgi:hypothetical protein
MGMSLIAALQRREVRLLMLFVIGFGLATLLRTPCRGFMCRHFVAPDLQKVEKTVWRHGTGCMKVKLKSVPCDASDSQIIPST